MRVNEKIKMLRKQRGWSQEEVAHKLQISLNSYGAIERGETDVNLSRLEDISEVFEVELSELFNLGDKNVMNLGGVLYNQHNWCNINQLPDYLQLKHENEKQQLIIEQKSTEIDLLKEVIRLMKNEHVEKF